MNREEALNKFREKGYMVSLRGMQEKQNENEKLINKIYDDFESRICENCKHYSETKKQCLNEEAIAFTSQEAIYRDDGCNKISPTHKHKDNGKE